MGFRICCAGFWPCFGSGLSSPHSAPPHPWNGNVYSVHHILKVHDLLFGFYFTGVKELVVNTLETVKDYGTFEVGLDTFSIML